MPKAVLKHWALLGVLLAALLLKVILLAAGVVSFDSDEAVVGLMARHIQRGARPIFFYGQAYMGSLDAWLVAGLFTLLGPSVAVIRAVQIALFLAHVFLTYVLARIWSGQERIALLSALLMALPPVLLTLYTTVSLGGYGEILVIGDLVLLVGWKLMENRSAGLGWWMLLGILAGLGFWTLGLIVVYLLPVGLALVWRYRTRAPLGYVVALAAFLVGSSPWWLHNLSHSWAGLGTLYDYTAYSDPAAPILPIQWRLLGMLLIGLPALIGIRLPWLAQWLPLWSVPAVVAPYGMVAWHALKEARRRVWCGAYRLLWGVGLSSMALLVLSRFGSDPTGRYLLPLYTPLSIFVASGVAALGRVRRQAMAVLVCAIVALDLWGISVCATSAQGLTAQYDPRLQYGNAYDEALIAFLEDNAGTRGYTHYWISFKIAFLSEERVILASQLPSKVGLSGAGRNSRYVPYADLVAQSDEVVYVTGHQPDLDALLRGAFAREGIAYREQEIGPYRVFYDLSSLVSPSKLDGRWQ